MTWTIPEDNEIPEELWNIKVAVELNSYQPAEPDVGIMHGYYEDIGLNTSDQELKQILSDNEEYLTDKYNDELQECDDADFHDEPPDAYDPPEPNFENTQAAGWWL